mgnify:CR=1 FL=1
MGLGDWLEKKTGIDIDRDGDVGGSPRKRTGLQPGKIKITGTEINENKDGSYATFAARVPAHPECASQSADKF